MLTESVAIGPQPEHREPSYLRDASIIAWRITDAESRNHTARIMEISYQRETIFVKHGENSGLCIIGSNPKIPIRKLWAIKVSVYRHSYD